MGWLEVWLLGLEGEVACSWAPVKLYAALSRLLFAVATMRRRCPRSIRYARRAGNGQWRTNVQLLAVADCWKARLQLQCTCPLLLLAGRHCTDACAHLFGPLVLSSRMCSKLILQP